MFATLLSIVVPIAVSSAPSPKIPNPVSISYGGAGANRNYAVSCWSGPRRRGTWLRVEGSTYTPQEALIYTPPLESLRNVLPSVLYCFGNDGKPGSIQGAPHGMMLPPGSRVVSYSTARITMMRRMNGKRIAFAVGVPLLDTTVLSSGPNGVVVQSSEHAMTLYPPGSTLTIGTARSVGYFRPGTPFMETPSASARTGCTLRIVDAKGVTSVRHYAKDCGIVWEEKIGSAIAPVL